ncbi:glycosyltransferase family 4 protein [Chroococcus sp. FPU101]|uniref:glycosyltransferase family 4 protein n=1 Tax=Chroococcus sp. FPU101 TaxID=1974212 RepID=UPI001A8FA557|nr:glycosyltransferase family 4 protein [Chroococcus sp. FPU101]GFE68193.1 glycosyl transferase, group 1 family protein [Chroococcus sp. FPU101]
MNLRTLQLGLHWQPENAGGLNRVYYDCIKYLPQVGVTLNGLVAGSTSVLQNSNGIVRSFASPSASLWHRWQSLRENFFQLLQENDYDLIVSHFALYTFPVLDQLGDRPLVIHFHGPWASESRVAGSNIISVWLRKNLEQITYQQATKFVVLSQAFREILHQEYRVPFEQIQIVSGGVEVEQFNIALSPNEARTKLGWSQERSIILAIRRLEKRMGLENLIAALAQVRQKEPDVLLLIAGKGTLEPVLKQQIVDLELTNHVRLLGYLPEQNLALAYRAANFSVVPTVALEGFGLIVIESLATGTPVLGTPVGGIPEILQPFSENLLFESCSTQHLAQGIIEVLSGQRQLPSHLACQTYVKENYAWPAIAQQIKSVYQKALLGNSY